MEEKQVGSGCWLLRQHEFAREDKDSLIGSLKKGKKKGSCETVDFSDDVCLTEKTRLLGGWFSEKIKRGMVVIVEVWSEFDGGRKRDEVGGRSSCLIVVFFQLFVGFWWLELVFSGLFRGWFD